MSFLKKLGLVEDIPGEIQTQNDVSVDDIRKMVGLSTLTTIPTATSIVAVPTNINVEELVSIEEVYNKFNIADMSKSIFKVEEFSKALPDSLPTDVKRQSVLGILSASGMNIDSLIADATTRTETLNSTLTTFTEQTNGMVAEAEDKIKDLEDQIDALKTLITERKGLQESEQKLIQGEVEKINKIVNFINGSK